MRVTLDSLDQRRATAAGKKRYAKHRKKGTQQRYGRAVNDHSEAKEIDAIGAEIAVGISIDEPWTDTDLPDYHGDLPGGVQVRHTTHTTGRLIVHDSDPDDHFFFLTTGTFPTYEVRGFLRGDRAKEVGVERELQRGRPAICVEQRQLAPVGEYRALVPKQSPEQPEYDGRGDEVLSWVGISGETLGASYDEYERWVMRRLAYRPETVKEAQVIHEIKARFDAAIVVEKPEEPQMPFVCGRHSERWVATNGRVICAVCHPPATPGVVDEEATRRLKEEG